MSTITTNAPSIIQWNIAIILVSGILTYLLTLVGHGWMLAIIFVFVVVGIVSAFLNREGSGDDDADDYRCDGH